jgi:hypothetical protein
MIAEIEYRDKQQRRGPNMKSKLIKLLIVGAVIAFVGSSVPVQAIPIVGDISFGGSYTVDNPNLTIATKFITFSSVIVIPIEHGDYVGTAGNSVTFTPFTFSPPTTPVVPLWTFTIGPTTYSFNALTMTVPYKSSSLLDIQGTGTAYITGRDPTPGIWNVTANKAGASFSFSSSAAVPDGGTTVLLLGAALSALGLIKRRLA